MINDSNTVHHSTIDSNINQDEVSNEISRFLTLNLQIKISTKLKRHCYKIGRKSLDELSMSFSCVGFKVKWMEYKIDKDRNSFEEEE